MAPLLHVCLYVQVGMRYINYVGELFENLFKHFRIVRISL
jgi:hypothetical protein